MDEFDILHLICNILANGKRSQKIILIEERKGGIFTARTEQEWLLDGNRVMWVRFSSLSSVKKPEQGADWTVGNIDAGEDRMIYLALSDSEKGLNFRGKLEDLPWEGGLEMDVWNEVYKYSREDFETGPLIENPNSLALD